MYTATLRSESNQRLFNTLSVTFNTLEDVLSPSEVTFDPGPRQIRVSWGPLQPARVQRYKLEYGAFPLGDVHTVTVRNKKSSVFLMDLEPSTEYLITVSALQVDGKERAISVRGCTQKEAVSALNYLQLAPIDQQRGNEIQASWQADTKGLKGFWVSWESKGPPNSPSGHSTSTAYLPPSTLLVQLAHLAPNSVCVSGLQLGSRRGHLLHCRDKQ